MWNRVSGQVFLAYSRFHIGGKTLALEVERKFLLTAYPDSLIQDGTIEVQKIQQIEQTYLALADGEELRIRRLTDVQTSASEYVLTYKKGYGMVREELEQPITGQLYDELMRISRLIPLTKERTTGRLPASDTIIEIDRYSHHPLVVVEVEFPNEVAARRFEPPSWFGPDISSDKRYSNKELWRRLNQI
jgi:adenylate cyclase